MSGCDEADECVGLGAWHGLLTPDTPATKNALPRFSRCWKDTGERAGSGTLLVVKFTLQTPGVGTSVSPSRATLRCSLLLHPAWSIASSSPCRSLTKGVVAG